MLLPTSEAPAPLPQHRYRQEAMATWFELRIGTADADYAAQAAQEAFARIDQLEALLSRYREDSEVRQLGRLPSAKPCASTPTPSPACPRPWSWLWRPAARSTQRSATFAPPPT